MKLEWKLDQGVDRAEGVGGVYELTHRASDDTAHLLIAPSDPRLNHYNNPGSVRLPGIDPVKRMKEEAQRREDRVDHEHEEGWWMPGKCVHIIGYGVNPETKAFYTVICGEVISNKTIFDFMPSNRRS